MGSESASILRLQLEHYWRELVKLELFAVGRIPYSHVSCSTTDVPVVANNLISQCGIIRYGTFAYKGLVRLPWVSEHVYELAEEDAREVERKYQQSIEKSDQRVALLSEQF